MGLLLEDITAISSLLWLQEGFNKFKGRWEVVTYPKYNTAINFWRKVLKKYTNDKFTEREDNHPWGRKIIFHFDNKEL